MVPRFIAVQCGFGLCLSEFLCLDATIIEREAFLLTVGAFLLTVELLCLQSVELLLRHSFPTVSKEAQLQVNKAKIVSEEAQTVSKKS